MAKSKAVKPPLKQHECAPLLGTYTSSTTGGEFVAAWQDGGFGVYRAPFTGPGQSRHLKCAHEFKRLLGFQVFVRTGDAVAMPAPVLLAVPAPAPLLVAEPTPTERPYLSDYTVIDTEFQGSDLLEVAAVRFVNHEPVGDLLSFVRFAGAINYHVGQLTGITSDNVRHAPTELEVMTQLRKLTGSSLLVAHNVAADRRIIELVRTKLGAPGPLANPWLCTMALARQRYEAPHKLSDLCDRFDIPTQGAHRAMNDVWMTFRLLQKMHQEQPITGPLMPKAKRKASPAQPSLFANAA